MENETEMTLGRSNHQKDRDRCEHQEHGIVSRFRAEVAEPGDGFGPWTNRRR